MYPDQSAAFAYAIKRPQVAEHLLQLEFEATHAYRHEARLARRERVRNFVERVRDVRSRGTTRVGSWTAAPTTPQPS